MSVKTATIGIVMSIALIGCSSSDPADPSSSPSTTTPSSTGPVEHATLSPSGFCEDRRIVGDLYDTIRTGTVPFRQAAASAAAVGKLMRANAELAPTDRGALKLRQFALYLNTLRLALMGAAANYPDDYAVKQFTNGLVNRVADISAEFDCPPA
jgi:hypothetical protein